MLYKWELKGKTLFWNGHSKNRFSDLALRSFEMETKNKEDNAADRIAWYRLNRTIHMEDGMQEMARSA